ncbi:metalloprotease, partial [Coemansia aciculifera]
MDFCKDYPLPDWTSGFEQRMTLVSQLPYEEYTGFLEKSASDTNEYKLIRLPNNLVVTCVNNAEAEMAAATLSVDVGANMDPIELQGLAHFLEHMLFMASITHTIACHYNWGTEKYPDENEYMSFISEHGGRRNASTGFSRTRYYFGVANDAFEEALDRFSSFFTGPLFKKECVDRELCAVDSEFKGLLNSDFWRYHQLSCELSSSGHPISKFMVGSIETLKQSANNNGLVLHEELLKFYNKYYSSDIMKLVVCGNHSLDQLVEWAASKFSGIKRKGDNVQRDYSHPVTAEFLGKTVYYETVDNVNAISIEFPVPNVKALYRNDPFRYIGHLIGNEGQGSLLAYLKKQGWATGFEAWSTSDQNKGYNDFGITINATPSGLENYANILRAVFSYVQMLITGGPQEWVQQEISSMKRVQFDYRAKTSALTLALGHMHIIHNEYVAPEHVLSKDNLYESFNYEDIIHCLSYITPSNFRAFLGAAKHASVDCSKVEPYFGTKYHVASISGDLLNELASDRICSNAFSLPEENSFIPTDFTIKDPNMLSYDVVLRPILLKLNNDLELWFKQDDQFNLPKGCIRLLIEIPTVNSSPQNHIM